MQVTLPTTSLTASVRIPVPVPHVQRVLSPRLLHLHRHRNTHVRFAEVEKSAESSGEVKDISVDPRSPSATGMSAVRRLRRPRVHEIITA
eukprot:jgi/Botrbrau1/10185/Bobra.116_1s0002.1